MMNLPQFMLPLALLLAVPLLDAQALDTPPGIRPISPALQQLETYIKQGMAKTGVPGVAVAVVYRDKLVYLKGFGVRKAGEPGCVNPDTVFQLASVSKPISSTVLAALVGRGEINWDDRIVDLDPGFKLSDQDVLNQITIRDLLSHRSGLPGSAGDSLEDLGFTRSEILHQMRLLPLTGTFRKTYEYSNFPFTEAGIAAAKAVWESWENLADDRLFKPLGMNSTSYRYSDFANRPNKAALHVFDDKGKAVARYGHDPDAEAPAGSASSSARDLAQWLRLQLSGGVFEGQVVVAPRALQETHSRQIDVGTDPYTGTPSSYGLGWNVADDRNGNPMLSHSGAFFVGAGTAVRFSSSDQLGIAVLTNALPTGLAEAVTFALFDLYRYGAPTQDWGVITGKYFGDLIESLKNASTNYSALTPPSSPLPAKPLSNYLGVYQNSYYGTIEITEEQGLLWMRLPGLGGLVSLNHWDSDLFTYRYKSEQDLARGVKFSFDGAPHVLLESLSLEGNGTFTRVASQNGTN
jgi:CubicO group peptidase (beta-lactamase class C family)